MRLTLLLITTLLMASVLTLSGSGKSYPDRCDLSITLMDLDHNKPITGIIRMERSNGEPIALESLLSRGLGVENKPELSRWSVIDRSAVVRVPAEIITLEALKGLETERFRKQIDLRGQSNARIEIPLRHFYRTAEQGLRSANTHLHVMKLDRPTTDRYLRDVPKADGLDLVFLSYLERYKEDHTYISNRYHNDDLRALSDSELLYGNGEEHRHNFKDYGEGYGHVMLLNINALIQPVSIGPGIMKRGTDGIPLQRGIDTARKDGATIVWCHNDYGMEDLPNWITGRLDAQNIFDGGINSSYKDTFYRYLQSGLKVPFSTGTDWFIYDFSRVYVPCKDPLTVEKWLHALAAGQSYITNGPFLEFSIGNHSIGDTIDLSRSDTLEIKGRGLGRIDFQKLELVHNGKVIHHITTQPHEGHHRAEFRIRIPIHEPGWFALRIPPFHGNDKAAEIRVPKNEFGYTLFGHTSPIYVTFKGKSIFDHALAQGLLQEMIQKQSIIADRALFSDDQAKNRVLRVYDQAIATLHQQIKSR